MNYIEPIAKLINQFARLPGVGQKTAQRYALRVVDMSEEEVRAFANALVEAKTKVKVCSVCGNLTDTDPCKICQTRDHSVICVVQEAKDVMAIERLGEYKGVYHVLGGVLNPLQGVNRDDLRFAELFQRLTGDVAEIIVATDTSAEGEATATYIARMVKNYGIKVTRLAQGISIGSELQYADEITLSRAFTNRREM
ncbi:MAG TPA: recombination protein RecR [Candidatus Limihabitans stercoravium]|nr:recombination protein RecR [Candidatus Limihabitans stercoravium]